MFFLHWAACRNTVGTVAWIEQRGAAATPEHRACQFLSPRTEDEKGEYFLEAAWGPSWARVHILDSAVWSPWLLITAPGSSDLDTRMWSSLSLLESRNLIEKRVGRWSVLGPWTWGHLLCSWTWTWTFPTLALSFLTCRHWVSTPTFRMVWGYSEPGERTDPQWAVLLLSQHCVVWQVSVALWTSGVPSVKWW